MIRILIDASICSMGGGVQVALSLINKIVLDPEFEIIFISSPQIHTQLTDEVTSKISYYYPEVEENIFGKFKQGKRIAAIEDKHKPDLVFIVFGPSYWRPKSKTLQGFALPLMVYPETRNKVYRNKRVTFLYQKILNAYKAKLMQKNADYVVVESETFKKRVNEFLGIDKDKIFVVENSFNSNFLTDIESIDKHENFTNIFIPTAYYPHKNLEILVDVAYELSIISKKQFKFNFLISESSPYWLKIIELAKAKKVQNYFYTYGPVNNSEMVRLYNANDFVLLPTVAEASTAVYPEAFVSKKVLLTSKIDFAVELCGDAAIYFDPYDAKDIAEKITELDANSLRQEELILKGIKQIKLSYLTPNEKWLKQRQLFLDLQ